MSISATGTSPDSWQGSDAERLLAQAAEDGSADGDWPGALAALLARLEYITFQLFPLPSRAATPPPAAETTALQPDPSSQESETANKENDPPASRASDAGPALNGGSTGVENGERRRAGEDGEKEEEEDTRLPPELQLCYRSTRNSLMQNFANWPPHTIQRLAELVLHPQQHYRFLPAFLRAVDRVVSVSSTVKVFPLPHAALPPTTGGMLNGTANASSSSAINAAAAQAAAAATVAASLGSDESLGGALLTPIPWLRADQSDRQGHSELKSESTEIVQGPNGAGRIETVSVIVNAAIPANSLHTVLYSTEESSEELLLDGDDISDGAAESPRGRMTTPEIAEQPHARGPEEIGIEDTGLQIGSPGSGNSDLAAAVGLSSPPPQLVLRPGTDSRNFEEEAKESNVEESGTGQSSSH